VGSEDPVPLHAAREEAFPAAAFEQVNPAMGDRIRSVAVTALGAVSGETIWDLYAGVGETTALLAGAGADVVSVEQDEHAVAFADRQGPPARRFAARAEDVIESLPAPGRVITNPPRSGMHERVVRRIAALAPRQVVYVSCDPATLARDITRFGTGFRLASLTAFDLFPQTAHVETVAVLERA
jgi:23S rRNA (uracil1939-C5)-methyltransferase